MESEKEGRAKGNIARFTLQWEMQLEVWIAVSSIEGSEKNRETPDGIKEGRRGRGPWQPWDYCLYPSRIFPVRIDCLSKIVTFAEDRRSRQYFRSILSTQSFPHPTSPLCVQKLFRTLVIKRVIFASPHPLISAATPSLSNLPNAAAPFFRFSFFSPYEAGTLCGRATHLRT